MTRSADPYITSAHLPGRRIFISPSRHDTVAAFLLLALVELPRTSRSPWLYSRLCSLFVRRACHRQRTQRAVSPVRRRLVILFVPSTWDITVGAHHACISNSLAGRCISVYLPANTLLRAYLATPTRTLRYRLVLASTRHQLRGLRCGLRYF